MKNLLKLAFILSIIIIFHPDAFAQFGIKASGGISRITNSKESSNVDVTTPFVPSGQGGIYYNLALSKKSSIGAELLFSQVEAKEKREVRFTDEYGSSIGQATALFYKHISYLSLPVYYGFNINKLTLNAGFQISRVLASSGREKNDLTFYGFPHDEINSSNVKMDDINITNFDLGPKAGIFYHLTQKLAVEGTYYYSIGNVNSRVPKVDKLKVQQMTVGIRYAL